jgi:hypothetical protein
MAREADGGAAEQGTDNKFAVSPPASLVSQRGAARSGHRREVAANPVTGTGSMTVPLPLRPGRSDFTSELWRDQRANSGCFYTVDISCTDATGSSAYGITSNGRKACIERSKRMRRLVVADRNGRILVRSCIPTTPRPPTRKRRDISAL